MEQGAKREAIPAAELLQRYLTAADETAAEVWLRRLTGERAEPVVRETLHRRLGGGDLAPHEVFSACTSRIADGLRLMRVGQWPAVEDFEGFASYITSQVCAEWTRWAHPERYRMELKLWYFARTGEDDGRFAIWQSVAGDNLYGLSYWKGYDLLRTRNYNRWLTDPHELLGAITGPSNRLLTPVLLERVLRLVAAPMELTELAAGLMKLLGIPEGTPMTDWPPPGVASPCLDRQAAVMRAADRLELSERNVVNAHLEQCSQCRQDVVSLERFREDLTWETQRASRRESSAVPTVAPETPRPASRLRRIALVALSAAVVAAGAWYAIGRRSRDVPPAPKTEPAMARTGPSLSARELFYIPPETSRPSVAPAQVPAQPPPAVTPAPPAQVPAESVTRTPPPPAPRPLGLRFAIVKETLPGVYEDADVSGVFRAGDKIRFRFEVNDRGYIYLLMRSAAGAWSVLYPPPGEQTSPAAVDRGREYFVPSEGSFLFDDTTGEEQVFVAFSRDPEDDLTRLLSSVQRGVSDSSLRQLLEERASAKGLSTGRVEEGSNGRKESVLYAVNTDRDPNSLLVVGVRLRHR